MSTESKNITVLVVFLFMTTILTLACLLALNGCIRRIPLPPHARYHHQQGQALPTGGVQQPATAAAAAAICVNPDGSLAVGLELPQRQRRGAPTEAHQLDPARALPPMPL